MMKYDILSIEIGNFMITILSKLIEFICSIIKRLVNKMKCYFSTIEGKTDSIIIGNEEYKISNKKKEKLIRFSKFYDKWKLLWVIIANITYWHIRNKYELGTIILITVILIIVPTQTVLYFGGISIIKDKKIDIDELK